MNAQDLRVSVLLTLQVSLLGAITPRMRAVFVSWTELAINIRVIFSDEPSPEEIEAVNIIETEVVSHMPSHKVIAHADVVKSITPIKSNSGEVFVFNRAQQGK